MYNRQANIPHRAVKGTWATEDTVIQHPEIHSMFDTDMVSSHQKNWDIKFLYKGQIECNVMDINTAEKIYEVMWKEVTDEWLTFENWHVQPSTGMVKYGEYKGMMYHYSLDEKVSRNINTPAVKSFFNRYGTD